MKMISTPWVLEGRVLGEKRERDENIYPNKVAFSW